MRKEKSCGCIVIKDNNALLIKNNYGNWSFPKGHVEKGESEQETAIRETKEETNIDVEIISDKKYSIKYSPKENVEKEVIFFIAKPLSKKLKKSEKEVYDLGFFNFREVMQLLSYEDIKEIFREFLNDYRKERIFDEK